MEKYDNITIYVTEIGRGKMTVRVPKGTEVTDELLEELMHSGYEMGDLEIYNTEIEMTGSE